MKQPLFLTGIGQDSHQLVAASQDSQLFLAGLPFACGLTFVSNSDGDVVLHALCNALSTAIGGQSFSASADPLHQQGINDSKQYVQAILSQVRAKSYQVVNVSVSIEAQQPRLEPYLPLMCQSIAQLLDLPPERVGIAVTSGEQLTACGEGRGLTAFVSILLEHQ